MGSILPKNESLFIAVTSKSFSKNEILIKELEEKFPNANIKLQNGNKSLDEAELVSFLKDIDLAIIGLDPITDFVLKSSPKLKGISKFGVGLNNVDLKACKNRGVSVGWKGGVNKLSVAEMTLGFMLGLSRNLMRSSIQLSRGEWKKNGGFQLSGKTVGIIGVGHIGKEVIRLLKPFNCKILANDIVPIEGVNQDSFILSSKEEIYKECDIITLHTPLDASTQNLINIDTMKSFSKSPYIINTARGGIIKEDDISLGLEQGLISGVALDAYEVEPLIKEDLIKNDQVICTPHIGGNSSEAVLAMGRSAIENLFLNYLNKG